MYKETLNIFFGIQRHQFYLIPMGIIVPTEVEWQSRGEGKDGYPLGILATASPFFSALLMVSRVILDKFLPPGRNSAGREPYNGP